MEPTGIAEEHPGVTRYRRIEEEIQKLEWSDTKKATHLKKATEILQEGEVTYPTGGLSIFKKLVGRTHYLYQEESFASLVKELYSSYQRSASSNKEEIFDIIWEPFGGIRIEKKAHVENIIAKIKIFLHLDDSFGSRFLAKFIHQYRRRMNSHVMDFLLFLVREGANPFLPLDGKVSFALFLKQLDLDLIDTTKTTMQSVATFLEEASKYVTKGEEIQNNILNDVVKAYSLSTYQHSSHFSSFKDLVVRICLEIIEINPASCDHVDGEGRTPLHNLMEKLFWDGLSKRVPGFAIATDSFWNLVSQLITEKNVNIKDKNQQTPYTIVLSRFCPFLNHESVPSFTTFLGEVFKKLEVSKEECKVNEVIKSVPENILESISSHPFSTVKELIVENCLKMIETNPVLCDHVDGGGRTPLHNLMELLLIDGSWKRMPGFVAGTDSLWNLMSHLITEKTVNVKDKNQQTPYTLFVMRFGLHLNDASKPLFRRFEREVCKKLEVSRGKDCIVNEVIKSVPTNIFEGGCIHSFSTVKELIVKSCLEMIQTNPAFCDHIDGEGRTPLHNLMDKLLIDGLWKRMPGFVPGTDSVCNLMSQMITKKTVNIKDKYQVTPFSWILWWQELVIFYDVPDNQKAARKLENMMKDFLEREASVKDAACGLQTIRGREMEGILKRLIKYLRHIYDQLEGSGRISEEILNELEQMVRDAERMRDLKSKGCWEYNTSLLQTKGIEQFAKKHMKIWNERILAISRGILQEVIVESNAQEMYGVILKGIGYKVNYYALFEGLKWCTDRGAHPTIDEIYVISLLSVEECTTCEALLATINMVGQLLGACRKQSTRIIKIFLNPIQDQWNVREDLRTAASEVIRAAYGTLSNCIKSGSLINILLFMRKDDGDEDIKKCFEEADALLQRDMRDPPVTKWIKEKGKHVKKYSDEEEEQKKELRWTLVKRNDNWLRRSVLHLAAIFCHDEQILNCIPKDIIKKYIEERDINGCTPLNIAHLHDNQPAITFLKSNNASMCTKYFEKFQEYSYVDHDTHFEKGCSHILKMKSNVLENMKKMLVLPVQECITIENALKELFTRMVANDGFLNAEVVMGGSVREKLKVGRWDEFDLQICTKIKPYLKGKDRDGYDEYEPFACLRMHEYLVKKMAKVDKKGIPLQCAAVANPCIFLWEGEGSCKGLQISVDVVIIHVENYAFKEERQGLIIDRAPGHQYLKHLKWRDLESKPSWYETVCRHEWDILANLPPGCRLGILICKAFLEALDQTSRPDLRKRPITSYVLKNVAFWLLSGRTPRDIEIAFGNVIGERYGILRQQLHFTTNDSKWMTEEDVERFAEEGRFWAEKIFDAIQFVVRECGKILGSFLEDDPFRRHLGLDEEHEAIDVLDTCGSCLEKLRPEVFFAEEVSTSPGWDGSDAGLRTRLQEVINRMNEEAEKMPGERLWRRKEVKRLKIRIDAEKMEYHKVRLRELKNRPEEEIYKLLVEHAGKTQSALLKKEEREYKELDKKLKIETDKFLEDLGHANNKESVLFRLRGEIEDLEKNNGLVGQEPVWGRDAELTRKRRECDELEKKVRVLREFSISHIERIEQVRGGREVDKFQLKSNRRKRNEEVFWLTCIKLRSPKMYFQKVKCV